MTSELQQARSRTANGGSLKRVVRALPERTLKSESVKAWNENKRWKQEKRHELAAWYEGYGAAIDWMLQVGKRPNRKAEAQRPDQDARMKPKPKNTKIRPTKPKRGRCCLQRLVRRPDRELELYEMRRYMV